MRNKLLTACIVMLALSLLMQGAGLVLTIFGKDMRTGAGVVSVEADVETVRGVATAKYIDNYNDTADMVITAPDGRSWRVQDYICPLYASVLLTIDGGEVVRAVSVTDFKEAQP